jgi:hypothetical protein
MTRQLALQAVMGIVGGAMADQSQSASGVSLWRDVPQSLTINLSAWKEIVVEHRGEKVSLDPLELFTALKDENADADRDSREDALTGRSAEPNRSGGQGRVAEDL